jgi:hypothetical protein
MKQTTFASLALASKKKRTRREKWTVPETVAWQAEG